MTARRFSGPVLLRPPAFLPQPQRQRLPQTPRAKRLASYAYVFSITVISPASGRLSVSASRNCPTPDATPTWQKEPTQLVRCTPGVLVPYGHSATLGYASPSSARRKNSSAVRMGMPRIDSSASRSLSPLTIHSAPISTASSRKLVVVRVSALFDLLGDFGKLRFLKKCKQEFVARLAVHVVVEAFSLKHLAEFLCRLGGDEKAARFLGEIERTSRLAVLEKKSADDSVGVENEAPTAHPKCRLGFRG